MAAMPIPLMFGDCFNDDSHAYIIVNTRTDINMQINIQWNYSAVNKLKVSIILSGSKISDCFVKNVNNDGGLNVLFSQVGVTCKFLNSMIFILFEFFEYFDDVK